MDIKHKVETYIARHRLLGHTGKHIVALSGGADSVALLLLLLDLGYDVEAAHCNFHLRGAESDRDEEFVKSLCKTNNVPLHLVHFDTTGYASLHKISIEMAARQLRYGYFEQLRHDIHATDICVAHHRDDSVETVIMNLIRGTGIRGLTGIHPVNGNIIRPLLCVSRKDIENYLSSVGQNHITDSSNLVDDVVRNKIRLDIIPLLKNINPSAAKNIYRTTEYMTDAVRMLDRAVTEAVSRVSETLTDGSMVIDIRKLENETAPVYLLYEMLKDYGFTSSTTEQVYTNISAPSGRIFSSAGYDLLIDRGKIIVEHRQDSIKSLRIIETGTYIVDKEHKIKLTTVPIDDSFVLSRTPDTVCLDAGKINFPLTLRPTERGDRFVPFGMKGSKLVSDYLTDRKRNLFHKRRQLILTDSSDCIIWLVNERPDNRFRISGNSTTALVISFI